MSKLANGLYLHNNSQSNGKVTMNLRINLLDKDYNKIATLSSAEKTLNYLFKKDTLPQIAYVPYPIFFILCIAIA